MIPFPRSVLAAVTAVGVLGAGFASAQPQGQFQGQAQGMGPPPQQQSVAQLLHLQPNQMAAYQALQQASRPTPDELSQMRATSPQALASLTTPERLDRIGAALAIQRQVFQRSSAATRTFYGQLTPDQRTTFDRISAPRGQSRSRGQGMAPQSGPSPQ